MTNAVNVAALGSGPAFYVSRVGVPQSPSSSTWTKVTFNSEGFDTNGNFTSSTFTPTVAGYYLISGCITIGANANTITTAIVSIYKNGTSTQYARPSLGTSGFTVCAPTVTGIVYMNGTTDYIELWGYCVGTSPYFDYGDNYTYLQGALLRGA